MRSNEAFSLASAFLQTQYEDAAERFNLAHGHADLVPAEDAETDFEARATWVIWFFLNRDRLEGVDLFPDYVEVFVDEQTKEAWTT